MWGKVFSAITNSVIVLGPLAERVYNAAADRKNKDVNKRNAPQKLVEAAGAAGIPIGESEARIVLSGIHLAKEKDGRNDQIAQIAVSGLATAAKYLGKAKK